MAHILVIDDDPQHRAMLQQMLALDSHQVETLENGAHALASCRARLPDLVLLDVLMPVKDGIDTAIELRAAFSSLPILAMSGGRRSLSPAFNLESVALVGADATLAKPFTRSDLQKAVADLLRKARSSA